MARAQRYNIHNPGQRQLRVGELLRRRLAELLQHGHCDTPILHNTLPVITQVRVSADLRLARAYVMPLGGKNMDDVVAALNAEAAGLRKAMMQGLRLKFSPVLEFYADNGFAQAQTIDGLLNSPAVRRDIKSS